MIVYPHINPIAFRLGPIKVHWYGVMYLIGFATAWLLARWRGARPGSTWKPADVDDLIFFGMVGGILGGRLGYVLIYGLSFWTAQNPWYPFEIWNRGMSIHGGFIGGVIAIAIFAWRRGRSVADVFTLAVTARRSDGRADCSNNAGWRSILKTGTCVMMTCHAGVAVGMPVHQHRIPWRRASAPVV